MATPLLVSVSNCVMTAEERPALPPVPIRELEDPSGVGGNLSNGKSAIFGTLCETLSDLPPAGGLPTIPRIWHVIRHDGLGASESLPRGTTLLLESFITVVAGLEGASGRWFANGVAAASQRCLFLGRRQDACHQHGACRCPKICQAFLALDTSGHGSKALDGMMAVSLGLPMHQGEALRYGNLPAVLHYGGVFGTAVGGQWLLKRQRRNIMERFVGGGAFTARG